MSDDIKKILDNHEERINALEKMVSGDLPKIKKRTSIKEFILSKKPNDDIQKTLLISYFIEKYGSSASFNVKDIKDGFRKAKEPLPSNINQMVNENIKKGYLMESEEKKDKLKTWCLTNSGEKFVENEM